MTNDEYLWDKSGPVDPEVEALERALEPLGRARTPLPERLPLREAPVGLAGTEPRGTGARAVRILATIAAGIAVVVLARESTSPPATDAPSPYRLEMLSGAPIVDGEMQTDGALAFGDTVRCDAGDRALIHVGDIGSVEITPGSEVAIKRTGELPGTGDAGYVLALEEGSVKASIFAAPRLFQLGTPSGIAVDLGCIYEATVEDEAGTTRLAVTHGRVSFETEQRRVLVPAGAHTRAYPGRGPGTPVWDDASPAFRAAVRALDEAFGAPPELLAAVLATEDPRDSLSLWHLLDLPEGAAEAVLERLAELAPLPTGLAREAILADSGDARARWRRSMAWN